MDTFTIEVTQVVQVELDPSKFDEEFMQEFRESFYPFDTLAEHAEHIAQLEARGLAGLEWGPRFIEGYGDSDEMGIRARSLSTETDVLLARSLKSEGTGS